MSEKFKLFSGDKIDKTVKLPNKKIIDRSKWPPGPWDNELDSARWELQHGFMGYIKRSNYLGHLCGYVGVPRSNQLYGLEYDHDLLNGMTTHGGLTFSGYNDNDGLENTEFWYFGFDCAHYSDAGPLSYPVLPLVRDTNVGTYRDWEYVTRNVYDLAEQLWARRGVL